LYQISVLIGLFLSYDYIIKPSTKREDNSKLNIN
jgi:hypothetical protein